MAEWSLIIEPWYKRVAPQPQIWRQPDAVLIYPEERVGIVIEVKLNWKDGRDVKLIDEYLGIVRNAEKLDYVWPLLITRCLRGWDGNPITSLADLTLCQSWSPGQRTPLMLLP